MSSDHFSDYQNSNYHGDNEDTLLGWLLALGLLAVAAFLWFGAVPGYVEMLFSGTSQHVSGRGFDIPGDGTIPGREPHEMAVVFFDVGFGDGILIQAPDNTTTLIDGGEGQNPQDEDIRAYDWAYELYLPFFQMTGINRLKYLINTVPLSHYMGVQPDIVAHPLVEVDELYLTGYPASHFSYRRLQAEARDKVEVNNIQKNQDFAFGPGVKAKVIFGQPAARAPGDASHILYLKYGDVSFIFMSALLDEKEEELVLQWGESLNADVIKVGRHGARNSTTDELLQYVNPSHAVISTSTSNPWFAPEDDVLHRLRRSGVDRNGIYRTDQQGHIVFFTDGRTIRVQTDAFPFI